MNRQYKFLFLGFLGVFALLGLIASPASAASLYWDTDDATGLQAGDGLTWDTTNIDWNSALDGTVMPRVTWTNGSDAYFEASGTSAIAVGTVTAKSLTFDGTGYTLGSGTITLTPASGGTSITANQSATINSALTLGAAQTWNVASGQTLTVGGNVAASSYLLTVTGAGDATISGAYTGTGGLTKTGAGTLKFNGTSLSLSGSVNMTGGNVTLDLGAGNSGTISAKGNFVLGSGGTFFVKSGTNTFADGGSDSQFCLQGGTTFQLDGGTVNENIYWGTLIGNSTPGTMIINSGTFNDQTGYGEMLTVGRKANGTVIINGGKLWAKTGVRMQDQSSGAATSEIDLNTGGVLQTTTVQKNNGTGNIVFNGGILRAISSNTTFINSNVSSVSIKAGGAFIDTYNDLTSTATNDTIPAALSDYTGETGFLTKVGAGKLTLSGANTYSGATTVNAGTLIISNTGTSPSIGVNNSGSKLYFNNGSWTTAPSVALAAGTTFGGTGTAGAVSVGNAAIINAGYSNNTTSAAGTTTVAGLSFGGTAAINVGALSSYTTNPAINVTNTDGLVPGSVAGSITVNPTATVPFTWDLSSGTPVAGGATSGTAHLIQYASTSGLGGAGFGAFALALVKQ